MASWELRDNRTGKNSRHALLVVFRQSMFVRIAGYEDAMMPDDLPVILRH